MNILITGAKGFAGRNLAENLKTIRDQKNRTRPDIIIDEIFEYDIDSTLEELDEFCSKADFVFNFAGVNRPTDPSDYLRFSCFRIYQRHHTYPPLNLSLIGAC